jgi:hypothetical protein
MKRMLLPTRAKREAPLGANARALRLGKLAALTFGAAVLGALAAAPARAGAEPYLGWDFGSGFGVGIGTPPSAYDRCPTYGWSYYPYDCRYRYYRPVHRYRHYRHRYYR